MLGFHAALIKTQKLAIKFKEAQLADEPYHGVMKPKDTPRKVDYDLVNNPKHYGGAENPYEAIKIIEAWGLHKSFNLGNALKYLARMGKKEGHTGLEDLKKVRWYVNREIENIEKGI